MIEPIDLVVIAGLIFGLVEFIKSLGVTGNKLRIFSMLIGGLFYGAFQLKAMFPEIAVWVDLALFVIGGGLSASGFYSFQKTRHQAELAATLAVAQSNVTVAATNVIKEELEESQG